MPCHLVHNFRGVDINTTAFCLERDSLHLLLLKSSMEYHTTFYILDKLAFSCKIHFVLYFQLPSVQLNLRAINYWLHICFKYYCQGWGIKICVTSMSLKHALRRQHIGYSDRPQLFQVNISYSPVAPSKPTIQQIQARIPTERNI